MKKVLLTLCALLMAVPAFAVEVYNNGENSVDIYGQVRGYLGYGFGLGTNASVSTEPAIPGLSGTGNDARRSHSMLYGLQGNSRLGTNIKLGNFSAQVELGFNEKTLQNQKTNDTIGVRQAWAAYSFGNAGRLLFGKTDTPTAMGGFISSFYDTDGGLNGFGGTVTGSRRFQVQYSVAGLTLALIEDDVQIDGSLIPGFTDMAPYTPRGAISYEFKNDSLRAKIAATYTAVNGTYINNLTNTTEWTNLHAFGITLGVRPQFGNMWLSVLARYGMNEDLYGEAKTVANNGSFAHAGYTNTIMGMELPGRQWNGNHFNDTHRAGAALEFGIKATESFTAVIGGGYQATIQEIDAGNFATLGEVSYPSDLVHSYAIFLQGQYKINNNFALVPEIAWFGTITDVSANLGVTDTKVKYSDSQNGLLVGMQFRAIF